jgi:RNA polymerase sigma-70 factor, ECF subfamily
MAESNPQHEQFVELLAASSKEMYSYIRTLVLNDENDAEDVFQSTCAAAWTKFEQFEPNTNFTAWAFKIAYYEVLRHRDTRRRIRYISEEALEALSEAAAPIAERVHERREALAECIEKLNREELWMIETRYFDAVRPKDIARRTGRTIHSIYRELSRINCQLLRCVERTMTSEATK